jgi:hypothetical protein
MKAMLLSKLKITACAAALMLMAGVGATGLTYRATAEQPQASTNRPQADDLEALRLEIEALRKSLQATRERVKTLESEVSALKGQSHGLKGMAPSGGRLRSGLGGTTIQGGPSIGMPGSGPPGSGPQAPVPGSDESQPQGSIQNQMMPQMQKMMGGSTGAGMMQRGSGQGMSGRMMSSNPFGQDKAGRGSKMPDTTTDPINDAAAALEFLRANPGDKQAIEYLERALKNLKEREKQKVPDQVFPGEAKKDPNR